MLTSPLGWQKELRIRTVGNREERNQNEPRRWLHLPLSPLGETESGSRDTDLGSLFNPLNMEMREKACSPALGAEQEADLSECRRGQAHALLKLLRGYFPCPYQSHPDSWCPRERSLGEGAGSRICQGCYRHFPNCNCCLLKIILQRRGNQAGRLNNLPQAT